MHSRDLLLAALLIPSVLCCSHVRVPTPAGDVIGRTMELAGEHLTVPLNWTAAVHPAGEAMGEPSNCAGVSATGWRNIYGFVSIDLPMSALLPPIKAAATGEGINSAGLTVSEHTLRQSVYQTPIDGAHPLGRNVCYQDFTAWALGSFGSVNELVDALHKSDLAVISEAEHHSGDGLHWGVDDAHGAHAVVEYLDGVLHVHNNTVGVMTNDPDFSWHLRNLNNFVSLSGSWPQQSFSAQTEVGAVPRSVGHGFNLHGIPGDTSPPGRFVKLFYLKEYAVSAVPAKDVDDGVVIATHLLDSVMITKGIVAPDRDVTPKETTFEFTHYSVLKIPQQRKMYFKTYKNTQWKLLQLDKIDLTKAASMLLDDGSLGVRDVSTDLDFN